MMLTLRSLMYDSDPFRLIFMLHLACQGCNEAQSQESAEDDEKLDEELAALKKKVAGDKAPSKTDKKSSN